MKIACISDTHNYNELIAIPECDILIHAGDLTGQGSVSEISNAFAWLNSLKQCKHIVAIAGNHDFWLQKFKPAQKASFLTNFPRVNYLENTSIEIEGLVIWGSPWTRYFYDWAFNGLDHPKGSLNNYHGGPGESAEPDDLHPLLEDVYSKAPDSTNIIVCHNPPYGILDNNREGDRCGSHALLQHIVRLQPRLVVCGHIHEAKGIEKLYSTTIINASSLNRQYKPYQEPVTIVEI